MAALWDVPADRPLVIATAVVSLAAAAVGLYIGYQAYRGLRRHDSEPMWYLSVGLFLLFGVAYVVGFLGTEVLRFGVVPLRVQNAFRFAVRLIQLVGLVSIAYSLYLGRQAEPAPRPPVEDEAAPGDGTGQATDADD